MQSFTRKNWLILIIFGLIGQIAWAVENMYFNLFMFETVSPDLDAVTLMVQLSGITATVITLIAGTLSDKLKNRRTFISIGYLIWGITVLAFAFVTKENTATIFNYTDASKIISTTLIIIIVLDCVMTAFGSTANDACFNAWVTDNSSISFRGRVESVLSIFPLVAMIIVAGGFGILVEAIGYTNLFLILGLVIFASGVLGIFIIKDSEELNDLKAGKFSDIIYGFKPSSIKNNAKLYITLCIVGVYGIACQIFMPYLIIFMKTYLNFTVMEYSLIFGAAIIIGSIFAVIVGKISDKINKVKTLYICVAVFVVGLLTMYLTSSNEMSKGILMLLFGVSATIMIIGYILVSFFSGALVRDYTPTENVGKMQGIRMIFSVLLPMFFGPMIGNTVNKIRAVPLSDELLQGADSMTTKYVPAPEIFFVSAIVALVCVVFIYFLNKKANSNSEN